MSKSKTLLSFFQVGDFLKTIRRFSPSVFCAFFLTAILIGQIFEIFGDDLNSLVTKLSFSLSAAFFAFIALKLFSEDRGWNIEKYFFFSVLLFSVISLLFFNMSAVDVYGPSLLSFGLFLLISTSPFFEKENDNISYCNFSCALSNGLFFSILAAAILSLGSYEIVSNTLNLFDVKISNKIYYVLSALSFALFAPLYFLSSIKLDSDSKIFSYPRGIKFITNFILIPLLAAYVVIVYAYVVKIMIFRELPKGILATMVLSLGSLGVLAHVLSYPLVNKKSELVKIFSQYFYPSLLIPLGFLFFAILKRINQYGVTENRYLAVLVGLWLLISCIYTIFTKAKNLKFVTICLAVMLVITSFGSWGITDLSQSSQVKRLKKLLEREGILVNGKIVEPENMVSEASSHEIGGVVEYMSTTKKLAAVKEWFPAGSYVASLSDNVKFIDSNEVMKDMGLSYSKESGRLHHQDVVSFEVRNKKNFANTIIDLEGFDHEILFSIKNGVSKSFKDLNKDLVLMMSLEENNLILTEDEKVIIKADLTSFIEQLRSSKQKRSDFIAEFKNENVEIKLYIKDVSVNLSDKPEVLHISGLLLFKKLY